MYLFCTDENLQQFKSAAAEIKATFKNIITDTKSVQFLNVHTEALT
jgi:hypothetical protein